MQTLSGGGVTAKRTYDAFGKVVSSTGTWSGPSGYGGKVGYQEDGNGLTLLEHRWYDAEKRRDEAGRKAGGTMITAYLMAACLLAPKEAVWAEGDYFGGTIPTIKAEVDGKEAYLVVSPSLAATVVATEVAGRNPLEATLKLGGHAFKVHRNPADPGGEHLPPLTAHPSGGVLGRDVLSRLALGFDPSGPRWRVWEGAVPEEEARLFVGPDPASSRITLSDNVALVTFFTAAGREDAVLNLDTNTTSLPKDLAEKGAGWVVKSNPPQRYSFAAGLEEGEGASMVPYEGNNEVFSNEVGLGAWNLSDLPFVVDLPGRRLWRQKPVGDRLVGHRLWTLTSLFLAVEGDRASFKAGGPNALSWLKPFIGREVVSIAGIEMAEIVRALRDGDQAAVQRLGEATSKTYDIGLKPEEGKPSRIRLELGS